MATEYVGMRMDQDLVKRIDKVAETLQMTRSAVLDRVVRIGLKEEENTAKIVEGADLGHQIQRAMAKALVSSDFLLNLLKMIDDDVDPKRVKMMREALASHDAKRKGKGGAKPALE